MRERPQHGTCNDGGFVSFPALVAPLGGALLFAMLSTTPHRRLPPRLASRIIAASLGLVLVAAVPTLWLVSFGYITHLPVLGGRLEWCAEVLGLREPVPHALGILGLAMTMIGTVRARRVVRVYRRLRVGEHGAVEIADHDRPFAFTMPGPSGRIVLSTGLVDLLDAKERAVVLAHERAHALLRHDRYLVTAELAEAVVPAVRPLSRRLQFTLERWADEIAVGECGDRGLVARTLGKVALRNLNPAPTLSFAGLGVPARVAALLAPPAVAPGAPMVGLVWSTTGVIGVLAAYQLHHLTLLIAALCAQ